MEIGIPMIAKQYMILAKRLRDVCQQQPLWHDSPLKYLVRKAGYLPIVAWILHTVLPPPVLSDVNRAWIITTITSFIQPRVGHVFFVTARTIHVNQIPKFGARLPVLVKAKLPSASVQCFIVAAPWRVCASKVSAACDVDPEISRKIWHICRLHHRCRTLFPAESARERDGSLLHQLWSDEQHPSPS